MALSQASSRMGFRLTFQDVCYEVPSNVKRNEKAVLLRSVTGYISPGQIAALMGPSGSGKTTLLDVLAGRKTTGSASGEIRYDGFIPTRSFLRRYAGYVEQFDCLLSLFTVREMILYTAELKRPLAELLQSKKAAVDKVVEKLGLQDCQNSIIGSALRKGISGGEAKRTNIGISIISSPRVLFLDEPTSGLDSYTANEVMTFVKSLAKEGTTICSTVHSPTPYVFNLFDSAMILISGQMVYFGPRGEAASYFEALTENGISVQDSSEAEWITDIVARSAREKTAERMVETYKGSQLKAKADAEIAALVAEVRLLGDEEFDHIAQERAIVNPFWHSLKTLIKYRSYRNLVSAEFLVPRIAAKFIFFFFVSTTFWGVGNDYSEENVSNIMGLLFLYAGISLFSSVTYIPGLILERPVFYRERDDGLYLVITYLMSKGLDEIIVAVFVSLAFGSLVFFVTQLQGNFLVFTAVYCGNTLAGLGIAYTVAGISPSMDAAMAIIPAYVSTLVLFAGFVQKLDDIPDVYRWYTKVNPIQYGLSCLLVNEFDTDKGKETVFTVPGAGGVTKVPVLEYYSIDDVDVATYTALTYVFFVAYFALAFLAMQYCRYQKR